MPRFLVYPLDFYPGSVGIRPCFRRLRGIADGSGDLYTTRVINSWQRGALVTRMSPKNSDVSMAALDIPREYARHPTYWRAPSSLATSPRSYRDPRATRVSTRNGGFVVDTQGSIALPLCVMEGRPRTWSSPGRRVVWPPRVEDTSHASTLRAGTDRLARAGAGDHGVSQRRAAHV